MTLVPPVTQPLDISRHRVGGLEVLLLPRPGTGLAAGTMLVRRGSVDEARPEHGLCAFTMGMLMRGTTRRDSEQLAYDLESIGAFAGESTGVDSGALNVRASADQFDASLEILFEALRFPALDARELEVQREEVLADLRMVEDDKFELTYRRYLREIFSGHGYSHPIEGEAEDVRRIDVEACRRWHGETIRPEACLFLAVGDFTVQPMLGLLDRLVAGWHDAGGARVRTGSVPPPVAASAAEITRSDLQQGFIVTGFRTPSVTDADYPALRLASAVLGEGFGGRIFSNLRDRRSLAYALGAMLRPSRLAAHQVLYIGTKPASVEEAREALLEEAERLRREAPGDEEMERARQYVIGKYLMGQQSLAQRVANLGWWEDVAGDAREAEAWPGRLRAVTAAQVREAAERWWSDPVTAILRPEA